MPEARLHVCDRSAVQRGALHNWCKLSYVSVSASHLAGPAGQLLAPVEMTLLMLGNVSKLCSQLLTLSAIYSTTHKLASKHTYIPRAGPVVVVGIREGSLWLVDARGQPFVVPVNHPGLKARCLAAQGDSVAAKALAERGILHASWPKPVALDSCKPRIDDTHLVPKYSVSCVPSWGARQHELQSCVRTCESRALQHSHRSASTHQVLASSGLVPAANGCNPRLMFSLLMLECTCNTHTR